MTAHIRGLLAFAIVIASITQGVAWAGSGNGSQSAAKLKHLKAEIKRLNANVAKEVAHKHHLSAQLGTLEQKIGDVNRKLATLDARAKHLGAQKTALAAQAQSSHAQAEVAQKALSVALRTAFVLGGQPQVKLVLEGEDPTQAARLLTYYGYYSRARAQRIQNLTARIARYRKTQAELAATEKDLVRTKATQKASLVTLKQNRTAREAVVAKLNKDIKNNKARVAKLERDAKRLESVINSVNRDIAKAPSKPLKHVNFAKLRGKLPWPVAGKIVDSFGSSRVDGAAMRWEAVRIAAPAGTRVQAIAPGRVAYAGWLPYYGLVLMVDHGAGYLVVYGHDEALYKQVGQRVKPGDVLATVGQSGGQKQPLLYFQIRHHNRPLNPARWCRNGHPSSK
jgi:septal ring factor EnvC (AmiA/AmiB activator)